MSACFHPESDLSAPRELHTSKIGRRKTSLSSTTPGTHHSLWFSSRATLILLPPASHRCQLAFERLDRRGFVRRKRGSVPLKRRPRLTDRAAHDGAPGLVLRETSEPQIGTALVNALSYLLQQLDGVHRPQPPSQHGDVHF